METVISLRDVSKSYQSTQASKGAAAVFKALFRPKRSIFHAVSNVSFTIGRGEKVAFIGPNGAGKSTTIKMLTGILSPTSGTISVLGLNPHLERMKLSFKIGAVFGQRSQLWFHLPVIDSFRLIGSIYELEEALFSKRLNTLVDLFEISPLLDKPAKALSLGERMRCDLVGSLLHSPEILFLDEPTIGLDINGKLAIRKLLNHMTKELGTTLFLTSHDTQDIEEVAERVIILDRGAVVHDAPLQLLQKKISKKLITVLSENERLKLNLKGVDHVLTEPFRHVLEIDTKSLPLPELIEDLFRNNVIKDITVEDPSLEEIIRDIYAGKP